ncbi:MAG: hypothetical protein JWM34_1808 [Ilumatobacteraceae bacterium]|nr:hypothetical protein [Ilumatobacteraceae bacterium]
MTTFSLDPSARRSGEGRVVVGGSPVTLMRLTEPGARLLDRIAAGDDIAVVGPTQTLVDRLLDTGLIHPRPIGGPSPADVSIVVPAFGTTAARLTEIVDACQGVAEIVIVDDASPLPIAPIDGATIVRRLVNGGPGASRDTGLAEVVTPFVAFVDADVRLPVGWLDGLLPHFADERVALVAPRVASEPGPSMLARYEAVRSPLDLGPTPARVRAGSRVSYVPAAVVVCRVAALRELDGFDDALRFGEDVDLVWRLDEAGWRVRYEPAVVAHHDPRPTLGAMAAQRFGYGTSAGALAARHPGALAPVRVSRWTALSWVTTVAGWPVIGAAIAAVNGVGLARTLRDVPDGRRIALRLGTLGHLHAGRSLADGVTRAWWPVALAASVVSRRSRRAAAVCVVVPAAVDWWQARSRDGSVIDPASYLALRIVDDSAYASGLFVGAWRERSLDALRPDLSGWPGRSAADRRTQRGGQRPTQQPAGR